MSNRPKKSSKKPELPEAVQEIKSMGEQAANAIESLGKTMPELLAPTELEGVESVPSAAIPLVNSHAILQSIIESLNDAFQRDPKAIWTLMNTYTPCNEALSEHPTVQVIEREANEDKKLSVGPLGLINGIVEAATGHRVCIMVSEPDEQGKKSLLGFDLYRPSDSKTV